MPFSVCGLLYAHRLYNTYTSMHTCTRVQHKHTHMKNRVDQEPGFWRKGSEGSHQSGLGAAEFEHSSSETQAPVWALAELTLVLNRTAFPLVESHKCLWTNYFNNALHLYTLHVYLSTPLLTVWRTRAGYLIVLFYGRGDGFSLQVPDRNQGRGLVSRTLAAVVCCEVMGKSTTSLTFPLLFLSGKYCL